MPVIGYQTEELPPSCTRERLGGLPPGEPGSHRRGAASEVELGWRGRRGQPDPDPVCHAQPSTPPLPRHCVRADEQGSGRESHPFLLARVCELTGGNSLAANIQLVLNNAALGATPGS